MACRHRLRRLIMRSMIEVETLRDLRDHVGESAGPTEWINVDRELIEGFGRATRDLNWYHFDHERASRELPGGKVIAHGLLLLALIPGLTPQLMRVRNHHSVLNYGFDGVRFTSSVPIDSRVRLGMKVKAARETSKGTLIERECVFELEGSERPALVCDWLALMLA